MTIRPAKNGINDCFFSTFFCENATIYKVLINYTFFCRIYTMFNLNLINVRFSERSIRLVLAFVK